MKSLWSITYVGAHTNIFIKKLQRQLNISVADIERERFEADGKRYERSSFLVEHQAQDWSTAIEEILTLSNRVTWKWTLLLDLPRTISAHIEDEDGSGYEALIKIPSGFHSLFWELKLDQSYERKRISGPKDSW